MTRCVATGARIAKRCGIAAQVLEDLNDLDYGQWQWRTPEEVAAAWPDLLEKWYATPQLMRFPSGDSLQDLVARGADALRFVLARHEVSADTVVLVGHDSVNRALLLQLLDQPLSAYWRVAQLPCAINEIDIVGGQICVLCINDTSHVRALGGSRCASPMGPLAGVQS
jgi:probable phosphoglycerate mutase